MAGRERERIFKFSSVVDITFWLAVGMAVVALVEIAFQKVGPALGVPALLLPIAFIIGTIRYIRRPVEPDDDWRPWWY